MIDTNGLQAAAGRFLSARSDPSAWEPSSLARITDLVSRFQRKEDDADTLRAGLQAERIGTGPSSLPSGGVAVLSLVGPLSPGETIFSLLGCGTSLAGFTRNLMAAAFDPKVKAIAVVVDSPGGSIRGVSEVAGLMRRIRDTRKPVVAAVSYAASASFWITSNASVVEAAPSASVGAIGIIAERVDRSQQLAKDGITVNVITAGKYKHFGHEALPLSDAEQQAIQSRVDRAYTSFVNDVAAGRHVSPSVVRSGYGEGDLVDAPDALRLGMIDRIATLEDTLARTVASPAAITACSRQRAAEASHAEINSYRERLRASTARVTLR